ncbi:MAG: cyclic nucleotide-binding domain-containing protein [Myxococcota bacterium]
MPVEHGAIMEAVCAHPLLRLIERRTLEQIVRSSRCADYRAKRTFVKQGALAEHAFFLLRGSVRVFHRDELGNEVLLKLFCAPALFGEMEILGRRTFLEYVTTLEASTLLEIPAAVFLDGPRPSRFLLKAC